MSVKIISKASVSNGCIAVTFRVNDDASSDSTATIYTAGKTAEEITAWVAAEKERVAREYEAHQNAHAILTSLT